MKLRRRLPHLLSAARYVAPALVALLFVLSRCALAVAASASASPAPAGKPLVNWQWLGLGLGGVVVLLALMLLLTRMFAARQRR